MRVKKVFFVIIVIFFFIIGFCSSYFLFYKTNRLINKVDERYWIYKQPKYTGYGTFSPDHTIPDLYYCQNKICKNLHGKYSDSLITKLFGNENVKVVYADSAFFMVYFVKPPLKTVSFKRKIGETDFIITPDTIYKVQLKPIKLE